MTFYRRNLPHIQRGTTPLFITFCTAKNVKLGPAARTVVLEHCLVGNTKFFELHAAVILTNHAHLLFSPLLDANAEPYTIARIMKGIKGASARAVNRLMRDSGSVWQDESFDHLVRTEAEFDYHYTYILQNAGEVVSSSNPYDYDWLWTPGK
ncbi:MAG: transposase [Acidobacteriaceae bacterium]